MRLSTMTAQRLATRAVATRALTTRALATTALAPVLAALLGGAATAGPVLPTGGKVAAGSAVIATPSATSLSITQSSSKVVIDWTGFSIGSGGKVDFANGKGATLNRVTGSSASALDGLLTATGSLFLINPNGVLIGKNGVVQTGGSFVASTQDLSDTAFLKGGDLTFTGASNAAIVNEGKVGSLGGDVALIAASVTNTGSVAAANGAAGLVSGYSVLMRDASLDNGQFSVLLGGAGTSVTNGGTIAAANAELRAEGGNVYALAGDTAGTIRATGVKSGQGKVWLVADGGTLDVAGTIEAQGAGGSTGTVETSGGNVKIGKASIDAHGGTWTVDPDDLLIDDAAAGTIETALNTSDVVEQTNATGAPTGAGQIYPTPNPLGDIIVEGAISWNTTHSLTLSSYHSLYFEAPITVAGAGSLTLVTDNTGAGNGGTLVFDPENTASPGIVQFTAKTNAGQPAGSLFIGSGTSAPQAYTLVSDLTTLSNDIAADAAANDRFGYYALATKVDGSNGGAGYTQSPLTSTLSEAFDGVLEGLGNTIDKLTINDTTNGAVGLFGGIDNNSVVRDLLLTNVSVTGSVSNALIGALAGINYGAISGVTIESGTVTGTAAAQVGGLVGDNNNVIDSSESDATVTDMASGSTVGGLVGYSSIQVTTSTAYGEVMGGDNSQVGGLIGSGIAYDVVNDTANGFVSGGVGADVGGLIGSLQGGAPTNVSASSQVTGGDGSFVGGLVGLNQDAAISNSYATGSAAGGADSRVGGLVGYSTGGINDSYVMSPSFSGGAAQVQGGAGSEVGGLVGYNSHLVTNSWSSASVAGGGADAQGVASSVGGLVGYNDGPYDANANTGGSITNAYAIGKVAGGPGNVDAVGGLVGTNVGSITGAYSAGGVDGGGNASQGGFVGANSGTISAAYYDQTTTGEANGVGNQTDSAAGVTGFTDDQASSKSTYSAFNFGGLSDVSGGATWVIVDSDGSLNNANGATGGTRPFLLSEYSPVINNSHELQLMALNLNGAYTGGESFDADDTRPQTAGAADMWSSAGFVPIGGNHAASAFTGSVTGLFVGQLYINDTTNTDVGLFGVLGSGASLNEVIVDGTVSSSAGNYVGVVAGSTAGTLNIVGANGTVSANASADLGGVAGLNTGTVTDGRNTAKLTGGRYSGGLVGENMGAITGSVDSEGGDVSGALLEAGGLVGDNGYGATIATSYAEGAVSGGVLSASPGGGTDVGGLVGFNAGQISASYATGAVSGGGDLGGLVGFNAGPITSSYATGAVTGAGNGNVGGLVGVNGGDMASVGSISDAYAIGAVSGASNDSVGGFVGESDGDISTSYATGAVSAQAGATPQYLGGFAGAAPPDAATFTDTYFDSQTTGQSVGVGDDTGAVGVTGLTTAQFMNPASFTGSGWSFGGLGSGANWVIVDADGSLNGSNGATRPFLTSEYSTTIDNAHQLQLMALDLNGDYVFGGDVDASATADTNPSGLWSTAGFVPIGYAGTPFTGTLNGRGGGEVDGLTINTSANYVGLFGVTGPSAVLKDFYLEEVAITGGQIVGAVVGANEGSISSVAVESGTVTGSTFTGGIAGYNTGALSDVIALETVNGGDLTGGVVGSNDVGGTITGSSAFNTVTGTGDWVGGLAGYNNGVIVDSLANGTVGGNQLVGGLVGSANTQSSISVSYAESTVTGSDQIVGGLVGYNAGAIANTYAIGSVQGADRVGGLVGFNDNGASVATSYADASVMGGDGATQLGGFAGYDVGSITFGYFNADDAGSVPGVGASPNADADNAGAVTANGNTVGRDPTLQQNYAGFDPSIWTFSPMDDEPRLTDSPLLER